ncbi:MerR family transcriptional regulator [Saccharopolyspora sp. NPDC000995]
MFSIGDFARHGRVSVRKLRQHDATGLLRPAQVNRSTGHRADAIGQLTRLNRVIALKELGFSLQQVQQILNADLTAEQLRGMLRLRQAELEKKIVADTARLAHVQARLRVIETEGIMSRTKWRSRRSRRCGWPSCPAPRRRWIRSRSVR